MTPHNEFSSGTEADPTSLPVHVLSSQFLHLKRAATPIHTLVRALKNVRPWPAPACVPGGILNRPFVARRTMNGGASTSSDRQLPKSVSLGQTDRAASTTASRATCRQPHGSISPTPRTTSKVSWNRSTSSRLGLPASSTSSSTSSPFLPTEAWRCSRCRVSGDDDVAAPHLA